MSDSSLVLNTQHSFKLEVYGGTLLKYVETLCSFALHDLEELLKALFLNKTVFIVNAQTFTASYQSFNPPISLFAQGIRVKMERTILQQKSLEEELLVTGVQYRFLCGEKNGDTYVLQLDFDYIAPWNEEVCSQSLHQTLWYLLHSICHS